VTSGPEREPEVKPSLASRMRHWMDAIVSPPPAQGTHEEAKDKGNWMAKISEPEAPEVAAVEQEPASSEPPQTTALAVVKPAEESFFAEESASTESAGAESAPSEAASAEMASNEVAAVEEAPIEAASAVVGTDEVAPVEAHAPVAQASESPKAVEPEPEPEIWDRAEETTPSLRDPDLVVPPAVRVTPEPLLVDEEPGPASNYGEEQHELPPAHAFEVAAAPEPIAEEAPADEVSVPEPSFEAVAAEPAAEYIDERVPTGPPPNREALAEIPFLNPPQGFDPHAPAPPASPAADASTVDAVVEKLLERLQPQLRDLLSQGVLKPLVENLLRQEDIKKEK
jgi:hypothetical protein